MTDLSQLDRALRNSFSAIKADMNELKESNEQSLASIKDFKKDIELLKTQIITQDQFKALESEFRNSEKRVVKKDWIEKEIKSLKDHNEKLNKDFNANINELNSNVVKINAVRSDIEGIKKDFNAKVERLTKVFNDIDRIKETVERKTIDKDSYLKQLAEMEMIKKSLIAKISQLQVVFDHFERFETAANKKFSDIELQLKEIKKQMMTENQVKKMVSEALKNYVSQKDFKTTINDVADLKRTVNEIKRKELEFTAILGKNDKRLLSGFFKK